MFRRFAVIVAAMLPLAGAAEIRVVEEIAAKVNGDIITRGELEGTAKEIENELRARGVSGQELADAVQQARSDALRDQIDQLLLVQKGKEMGISVDTDVSREFAQMQVRAKLPDADQFAAFVRKQFGVSVEELKQRRKDQLMAQRVISSEVGSRLNIPIAELQKYYDGHKADFIREERVFLSQILISTDGKDAEQIAAADKKAQELVTRARQGEKFSELATAYSDDAESAKNGGYIDAYKKGDLRPEIAERVFNQKKGHVTDPIQIDSPKGLLILKVEEAHAAGLASFEEVKDEIMNIVAEPKMSPRVREYLTGLRYNAFLEVRKGYIDSGAAPGKDTSWQEAAQIRPQTTTKAEAAAARKKRVFWLIPYGTFALTEDQSGTAPAQTSPAAETPAKK